MGTHLQGMQSLLAAALGEHRARAYLGASALSQSLCQQAVVSRAYRVV